MTTGSNGRTGIAIVGGGVIGLAIAFELAQRGGNVTVLESHRIGEQAAAGVAAGMLAPRAEADLMHPDLTRLAVESHALYPGFVERVEAASGQPVGYDRTGTLFVALNRDHGARLEHLRAFQCERGLSADWLTAQDIRAREPALAPSVVGALLLEVDHQVNPRHLLTALVAAITAQGGLVMTGATVTRVESGEAGATVIYDEEGTVQTLHADAVVIAAGAWSSLIEGCMPGLPLRPVKGQILRLHGERLIRHVVRTPDVYLVPRKDGELVIGATMEERGFDRRIVTGAVRELLREAWCVVPGIDELELSECSVGFRPALRDGLPAIGATGMPGVYLATGHFRNGVELAPLTARLVADLVCEKRVDPLFGLLDPMRFAEGGVRA